MEIIEDFLVSWIQAGTCRVVFKWRARRLLTDRDVNKEGVGEGGKATDGMQIVWTPAPAEGDKISQPRMSSYQERLLMMQAGLRGHCCDPLTFESLLKDFLKDFWKSEAYLGFNWCDFCNKGLFS